MLSVVACCLLVLAGAVLSEGSRVDTSITYKVSSQEKTIRSTRGYISSLQFLEISFPDKRQQFSLLFQFKEVLLMYGSLTFEQNSSTHNIDSQVGGWCSQQSDMKVCNMTLPLDQLNLFLRTLAFDRKAKTEDVKVFQLEYNITLPGKYTYDSFFQTITLSPQISVESLQKSNSILLQPDKPFSVELYKINEDPQVIQNLDTKIHTIYNGYNFFSLRIDNNIVMASGTAPGNLTRSTQGRFATNVIFYLLDRKAGDQTGMYSFYLELDPSLMEDREMITFYIYGGLFVLFIMVVLGFIVYAVKKDKQLRKLAAQQVAQAAEAVQENVLTKSIVEWTKVGNGSTRDQTDKDNTASMISSNERYTLKKGKKPAQAYKNLTSNEKDVSHQADDRSIEMSGATDMGARPLSQNDFMDNPKPSRPIIFKATEEDEEDNKQSRAPASPERRDPYAYPQGETMRDQINLSQFELSKIEGLDNTMLRNNNENFDFGDISKMGNQEDHAHFRRGQEEEGAEAGDLQLEDIILKEL